MLSFLRYGLPFSRINAPRLSEKEAAVYLAALQLGWVPVQDIAKLSKVNRATTYVMIESLKKRYDRQYRKTKTYFYRRSAGSFNVAHPFAKRS